MKILFDDGRKIYAVSRTGKLWAFWFDGWVYRWETNTWQRMRPRTGGEQKFGNYQKGVR